MLLVAAKWRKFSAENPHIQKEKASSVSHNQAAKPSKPSAEVQKKRDELDEGDQERSKKIGEKGATKIKLGKRKQNSADDKHGARKKTKTTRKHLVDSDSYTSSSSSSGISFAGTITLESSDSSSY